MNTPTRETKSTPGRGMSASIGAFSDRHLAIGSTQRQIVSGTYWSLIGATVARGLTLGTSIALARMLGKEAFGAWGLVLAAVSAFSRFGLM